MALLRLTDHGLYCEPGDFYIDPWGPVERAVITHAHADHARRGSGRYLAAQEGAQVLRTRLGPEAIIRTIPYRESMQVGDVQVRFYPAGHILGSAQVRLEVRGEVWVVAGDYKIQPDQTCTPFEPVRCHTFITESTFGLPIFRWPPQQQVFEEINAWWQANQAAGKATVLYGYALGKAQRLLAGLDPSIGPIFTHGAVERINEDYRQSGIRLPATTCVGALEKRADWSRALILAPPSAHGTPWLRKFGVISTGFASGWMQIRGLRRRRSVDRGFVLSDHVDWPGLNQAIRATSAQRIWVTHGYSAVVARWLQDQGLEAQAIQTAFEGEREEVPEELDDH
jgi:putative mRNA 3-end processing factor